jgi:hypothetical protein
MSSVIHITLLKLNVQCIVQTYKEFEFVGAKTRFELHDLHMMTNIHVEEY